MGAFDLNINKQGAKKGLERIADRFKEAKSQYKAYKLKKEQQQLNKDYDEVFNKRQLMKNKTRARFREIEDFESRQTKPKTQKIIRYI
jgi:hypothetical protein